MNHALDISIYELLIYTVVMLLIPTYIMYVLKIKLLKKMGISVLRMFVQLAFVAVYLGYIFQLDNIYLNFGWLLVMIFVANFTIVRDSGLRARYFFFPLLPPLIFTVTLIVISFLIVFTWEDIKSARYIIPLGGMVLGNMLRGNVVALDRFYSDLRKQQNSYYYFISLGATEKEAVRPFMRDAVKAAMAPQLATLATIGLVSLPGMMTGQILGGSTPTVAIKYQILILISIFVSVVLSSFLTVQISLRNTVDSFSRFEIACFRNNGKGKK